VKQTICCANRHGAYLQLALSFTLVMLGGCVSEHRVTTRPEYAYPQNLVSLCGQASELTIVNAGEFASTSFDRARNDDNGKKRVLLSAQLLQQEPAQQRRYQYLRIVVAPGPELTVTGYDKYGQVHSQTFTQDNIHCDAGGELSLSFPSSSYYLWATMITRKQVLAMWTNTSGGLVLQPRWQEKAGGIVWGTDAGDAWAAFEHYDSSMSALNSDTAVPQNIAVGEGADCVDLSGNYAAEAEVVYEDGSLGRRQALDQFFREEIIGPHVVHLKKLTGNRLRVQQDIEANTLELILFANDEQLVSRKLVAKELSCEGGRWRVKGDKKVAPVWLVLMGSGGVSWESLTLWHDHNGDLLVAGVHKTRNVVLLIPFVDTRNLFMAFSKQKPENGAP
jgi:hypothetical protein